MNWRRNLRLSMRALVRAPLRTVLSASGLSIGIAALVLLCGIAGGAERAFRQAVEGMGKNLLSVGAERREAGALRGAGRRYKTLTLDDWRAIGDELDCVERAAPIAMNSFDLRYGGASMSATVIGTSPEYRLTNNANLVAGRFFDQFDGLETRRVAVIGAQVVRDLFFGEQPLGELLLVGGMPFVIIGVLEEKGTDPTGATQDDRILVPVLTAQRRLLKVDFVDRIFVQATSRESLGVAQKEVGELIRARHGLDGPSQEDDFTIRNQDALLRTLDEADRSLSRLLLAVATLTLTLGSLGLMAVSLLSVRERHGEIGLRLAVGALPRHVLFQFLAEAVMVAGLGALFGLLVGGTGIIVGERLIGWQLALTWEAVVYPFLVSLVLSLVSGAYPALRAARLDPILALRRQ